MSLLAKFYAGGAVLLALLGLIGWGVHSLKAEGAAQCVADVNAATQKSKDEAVATEAQWKAKYDAIAADSKARLGSLAADRDSLLAKLRNRPERRPDVSGAAASACAGATGAELARPDAEFLGRYGAIARGLQLDLDACQAREAVTR